MTTDPRICAPATPLAPEDVVRARVTELQAFATTNEFDSVAAQYGFTTADLSDRYIQALLDVAGIDYDGLRQSEILWATSGANLVRKAATGPALTVWSAATLDAFTVCGASGRMIWHERFGVEMVDGVEAATLSAEKAIELAAHALAEWGGDAGVLRLNLARSRGLDFARLHRIATTASLVLDIATVPVRNPAAEQCTWPDQVRWRTVDLHELWDAAS
ncbi:hypothetical protein IU487_14110 [Nocardia puris]|uniref:hypothetical protein n=1 Tax=Nocardia puris TaxID=208602 RepID=UPI001895148A|nr:hypothetical protein [Nocardia puris]MBF6212168.1 hypothetical protein [Nocardia puris]